MRNYYVRFCNRAEELEVELNSLYKNGWYLYQIIKEESRYVVIATQEGSP